MSVGTIYRLFSVQHSLTIVSSRLGNEAAGNMAVAKRHQVERLVGDKPNVC